MRSLLTLALLGCGGSENPAGAPPTSPGWTDPGLDATGAAPSVALHLATPTRIVLPETSLPPGFDPGRRFALELTRAKGRKADRFSARLPFDVGDEGRRFAPRGMRVFVDGQLLPYNVGPRHWTISGSDLVVRVPDGAPEVVEVAWGGVEASLARHEAKASGLTPEAFVRAQVTLADHTRDGLLLPAPALAEWTLTVPAASPRFDTWLALEPSPVLSQRSDGAKVSLVVIADGAETRVDEQRVRLSEVGRSSGRAEPYQRWVVGLERWKGREVTLRIETDPDGSPWFDYVFLGSPAVSGAAPSEPRRVVVVGLDTTRPDHLGFYGYGLETSPELDRVARQSVIFDRAWAPAPRTRPSFRAATTGRYPLDAVGATNISEVFQRHGFATAAWTANVHLQPRFDFHRGFDSWHYDGKARAGDQVGRALEWLADHANRDTYLFLHLMDPHVFYDAPGAFAGKFVTERDPALPRRPNRWLIQSLDKRGALSPVAKAELRGDYDAEIAYMSSELGRFFEALDAMGGRTLVVVHSDHGEEFWEHGGYEHNHSLYDEVTRAVLFVRSRSGMAAPRRIDVPVTLVDIAPTLYDFAGFADAPPTDGTSLRPLIEGSAGSATAPGFARPIGIAHLRYGLERWGVIDQGLKYVVFTASGAEELYDLAADPAESRNLVGTRDTTAFHGPLSRAHAGMPVGPGWRIRVDAAPETGPLVFTLPVAPIQAGIIDPERTLPNPSNDAWGEPPRRRPEEIGTTELAGTTLTWVPGHRPRDGLLFALFSAPVAPAGVTITVGGAPFALSAGPDGELAGHHGSTTVRITAGTVVVPLPGEAERMAALGGEEVAGEDLELLKALGYIGGGEDEHGSGEPDEGGE